MPPRAIGDKLVSPVYGRPGVSSFGSGDLLGGLVGGSVGGVVGGVLATVGAGSLWLVPQLPLTHALVLGVLGSRVGQVGDLFESMLKRQAGIKDSSNVLPGHGGVLDRIDSLTSTLPMVALVWLLMR